MTANLDLAFHKSGISAGNKLKKLVEISLADAEFLGDFALAPVADVVGADDLVDDLAFLLRADGLEVSDLETKLLGDLGSLLRLENHLRSIDFRRRGLGCPLGCLLGCSLHLVFLILFLQCDA